MAMVSGVRVCRDCGGVRTLSFQLPAGSNAMHEVSHDLLFTAKLIRPWGEVAQVLSSDVGAGSGRPCLARNCGLL